MAYSYSEIGSAMVLVGDSMMTMGFLWVMVLN